MDEYFQGKTDANVKNLFDKLNTMDSKIDSISQKLEGLAYWRAKVSGIAVGASAFVSIVLKFIHLRN